MNFLTCVTLVSLCDKTCRVHKQKSNIYSILIPQSGYKVDCAFAFYSEKKKHLNGKLVFQIMVYCYLPIALLLWKALAGRVSMENGMQREAC